MPALRKQFPGVTQAEREAEVESNGVPDDVRREPVAAKRGVLHLPLVPQALRSRQPQCDRAASAARHGGDDRRRLVGRQDRAGMGARSPEAGGLGRSRTQVARRGLARSFPARCDFS